MLKNNLKKELGPRRKDDIPYFVADNTKFKKKFNWVPKYNDLNYILKSDSIDFHMICGWLLCDIKHIIILLLFMLFIFLLLLFILMLLSS